VWLSKMHQLLNVAAAGRWQTEGDPFEVKLIFVLERAFIGKRVQIEEVPLYTYDGHPDGS
jgi:hypothetical protein